MFKERRNFLSGKRQLKSLLCLFGSLCLWTIISCHSSNPAPPGNAPSSTASTADSISIEKPTDFDPEFDPGQGPLKILIYANGKVVKAANSPPYSDLAKEIAKVINSKAGLWGFDYEHYPPEILITGVNSYRINLIKSDSSEWIVVNYIWKYNSQTRPLQMVSTLTTEEYDNICDAILKIAVPAPPDQ